jgi:hypothetical protein
VKCNEESVPCYCKNCRLGKTNQQASLTPLGVRTIVALAITPLVLVIDDSTTREASQVTSREWRMKIKGFAKIFVLVTR